jgi:hypothetical protein
MSVLLPIVMEHNAAKLTRLGPRCTLELLLEIGRFNLCLRDVAERLARYAEADPRVIRAVGADRMIPRPLTLVSTNQGGLDEPQRLGPRVKL